jgi:hypothetical protein
MQRTQDGFDLALTNRAIKAVFDWTIVVARVFGSFKGAHARPAVSTGDMSAPPWIVPPGVQSSGRHGIERRTDSGA